MQTLVCMGRSETNATHNIIQFIAIRHACADDVM
jgi:hypothetical protein